MRSCERRTKKIQTLTYVAVSVLLTPFLIVKYATAHQSRTQVRSEACQNLTIVRGVLRPYHVRERYSPCFCNSSVSVVTAYFDIGAKSKHAATSFAAWNERFFKLADNMVIFTDENSAPGITRLRSSSLGCTTIVLQNLHDLDTANMVDWELQHRQDPEQHIHSTELYIIWNQKSFWLDSTARINPFRSTHFFWADSGQFRDQNFLDAHLSSRDRWLTYTDFIPPCTMAFLAVEKFSESELAARRDEGKSRPLDSALVRLGGGNFGGDKCAVIRWKTKFQDELMRYVDQGVFVGKDQPMYGSVCIDHKDLCFVVNGDGVKEISDIWFAMQPVLHGVTRPVPQYIYLRR